MPSLPPDAAPVRVALCDLAATEWLAARVAALAEPGEAICLAGPLGAGKTAFARAFLAAFAAREGVAFDEEVPSPTFTLVQDYVFPRCVVHHFDLYRVADPAELVELGIEEALAGAIALIEWPDRLGEHLPDERLEVVLDFAGPDAAARTAALTGFGRWAARLAGAFAPT